MASGREESTWGNRKVAIMIAAFMVSLVILVLALTSRAIAEDSRADVSEASTPLVIPIFPRLRKDPSDDSDEKKLPEGADLRDSYIVMEDGSVLSMADWIKGALTKNDVGAGMSDYDTRLFLGQVARAIAGQNESQVTADVASVGPVRPFTPGGTPKSKAEEALAGLVGFFLVQMPDGYSAATSGGGFNRRMATEGGAAVLFEEQFLSALQQSAEEFQEAGAMQNMLESYKKKTGQQ